MATQATIDLADATISFKSLRKPTTQSEAFYILEENGIIDLVLTKKMVKMTGFRNVVAHDYEKIKYDIVYDILHNRLADIEEFLAIIKSCFQK